MASKRNYEKPYAIDMVNHAMVYGQEVSTQGLCSVGDAPAGAAEGCKAGGYVTVKCRSGIGVTTPNCETGSFPYYGDLCASGGTHTG